MTTTRRTGTSARSITARLRPGITRPRPAAVLMLVVVALVVGLGVRFATPRAAASTRDQTYDSGDFSITLAEDGTVTILDQQTGTALQGAPDPAAAPIPQDEMRTQVANLATQVENNLGWDVKATTDRSRMIKEIETFHQKLDSVPQATLDLKENAGIRALRDILGTKECRARCLELNPGPILVLAVTLAVQIRYLRDTLHQPGAGMTIEQAAFGIAALCTTALFFAFAAAQAFNDPQMPAPLKIPIHLLAAAIMFQAGHAMSDLIQFTAQLRTTLREESTGAAKAIASLTPDGGPADGYDLVKDEL
jgi:hypothetical protein